MNKSSFNKSNNWDEFPELKQNLNWQKAPVNDSNIVYMVNAEGKEWQIRANDFPDEPCYTLIINKNETLHFDDWPSFWCRTD